MNPYLQAFLWICAGVGLILFAGLVQHWLTPKQQPELPPRPWGRCHVRGCGVKTFDTVTRYDSGTDEWTCQQCRYEGAVLGRWSGEVAA